MCDACPVKGECTGSKSGRHIFRSFHQEYIDKVKAYYETEAYKKASRKRSVWVEPLFGEANDFHRLRRFRLRGLRKVNIEGMMIAAGQNLKRLIKHRLEKLCFLARYLISHLFLTDVSTFPTAWNDLLQSNKDGYSLYYIENKDLPILHQKDRVSVEPTMLFIQIWNWIQWSAWNLQEKYYPAVREHKWALLAGILSGRAHF